MDIIGVTGFTRREVLERSCARDVSVGTGSDVGLSLISSQKEEEKEFLRWLQSTLSEMGKK
jgi:hypothetical protein